MNLSISEKITLLNQTALESLSETVERNIYKNFTETGLKILGADFGFAWFKPTGKNLPELAYKSSSTPYIPQTPRKHGVNYKIQRSKLPFFSTNIHRAGLVKADARSHMKSVAAIPMVYNHKIYGNILLCFTQERKFTAEDKSLCTAIGNTAAQAITINRLYADLKEFKNTLDSTLDSILIFNEKTLRIEYVNQGVINLLGISKANILKHKVSNIHKNFGEQAFREYITPLIKNRQKSILYETDFLSAAGAPIPVEVFLQKVKDGGQEGKFLAIVRDVSERKKSEAALKLSEAHNRFLADAGKILSSSLDYRTTLKSVAELAIPQLGDWCVIEMLDGDHQLKRIASAHADGDKNRAGEKLQQEYPPNASGSGIIAEVLRSGTSAFFPEISDHMLKQSSREDKHYRLLKKAGPKSVIIVPIKSQDRTMGTITLISTSLSRRYGLNDLFLAEELARRASLAIENSFLYTQMEERVRQRTRELIQANEILKAEVKERKAAEDRLRESEARLSEAQALAHLGSWEWDVAQNTVTWSDELCRIYGVPAGFSGTYEQVKKHVHPEDLPLFEQLVEQALKQKQSYQLFHRIIRSGGDERILSAYGQVVTNPQGRIMKLVGTAQDVTERRRAEIQLEAHARALEKNRAAIALEKAKDEAVLSGLGEGVMATDEKGKLTIFNKEAERLLKVKAAKVLGKSLFEVQPMFDEQGNAVQLTNRPAYLALQKGKRTSIPSNKPVYLMRGKIRFPVALTVTPIFRKGKIIGAVQIVRDITQEREIDRVKSELISLVSHQLRTPLSAINWYTETLLKEEVGRVNAQQKKYLQEVFDANKKMVELVYGFLNVSRIELGTFSLKLTNLDIIETSQSVLQELAPLIKQKKLSVKEDYPAQPVLLEFDRKIIRIIFQNLLTNSVKYTKNRGKIKVTIRVIKRGNRQKLHLEVADNGLGIPKKQQPKIFTKLFRADNVTRLDTEGTGLGLYIVKSFVDYIGGTVWFTSKENVGTTFFVELPIKKSVILPEQAQSGAANLGAYTSDETKK